MFKVPEKFRVKTGRMRSDKSFGNNGQFRINSLKLKDTLFAQASDGAGWEHVSVSRPNRCPSWEEMAFIKALFWDEADAVIQIHPPKEQHINNHNFCLHLWRKSGTNSFFETPPRILI